MSRLDLYTAVHKMQRARLFELTIEAGRADPADRVMAERLAACVDAMVVELQAHARHEDRFIHPLLRATAPILAAALDTAHVELDARLDELSRRAAAWASGSCQANDLYRALASFTAVYLDHLGLEETEALPALWDTCSDEELVGILAAFRASRSDAENLTSVLAQLATMNPPEIVRMVEVGLGPVAPAEVADLLATVLDPVQLGSLGVGRLVASTRAA